MVNVVLFYGNNFISPGTPLSYTSIMVSSHFISRRLTQFAASAWLLVPRTGNSLAKSKFWAVKRAVSGVGERWVMISTGVLWLSVWLCVSWQHHSAQKVMNCVTSSPTCPLIGQHSPFRCFDWLYMCLQCCNYVILYPNLVVVQFACTGWHLVPQLSPLIFDGSQYHSIYWAGGGKPRYC